MKNLFTDHPQQVGETYFSHAKEALRFSLTMFVGSVACFIHAIFPFLYQKTASNLLTKMVKRYQSRTHTVEGNVISLTARSSVRKHHD